MPKIRIGIIGWNYPEWRGGIYSGDAKPQEFLAQYARRFPIVEAASSYYGMPKTDVVAKWAAATPDGFEMALKIPDWILKKDPADPDLARALDVLLAHLAPLEEAGKLGTLVAQFHPTFRRDKKAAALAGFVGALPQVRRWAIELRHPSWWHEETYRLLRDAGVTLVWSTLGDDFRTPPIVTGRALYLRLFGDRTLEAPYATKRRDAREELEMWAERIRLATADVERVDVLVSKYLEGYAPGTAQTLAEMLGVAVAPAPPRQTTLPFA